MSQWYAKCSHKHGAQRIYSDKAIEVMGIIRLVFHLPLRQTQGFMESIAKMMKLDLLIPDFSTLSRRMQKLRVNIQSHIGKKGTHIIIDTTTLTVYGANDYHKLKNRIIKFKGYRKLNIAINEHQEIVACELTTKFGDDTAQVPKLLRRGNYDYDKIIADGNYDDRKVYGAIKKHIHDNYVKHVKRRTVLDYKIIIPPRRDARPRKYKSRIYPVQLSEHIHYREQHGRINWQKATGYGERSLVEVDLACKALNIMTSRGMPVTEKVS